MISKSSIGVLSALVLPGFLICGILGTLFPQRVRNGAQPWGTLPTTTARTSFSAAEPTSMPDNVTQMLRLAPPAIKQHQPAAEGLVPIPSSSTVASSAVSASPEARFHATQASLTDEATPRRSQSAEVEVALNIPDNAASDAPVALPHPATVGDSPASGLININTASVDTLNRIPGAGHIGRAIVRHRPYRAITELVERRVLRLGAFEKVKPRIATD